MKKPVLNITDKRMWELPGILKQTGSIKFKQEFFDTIKISRQNFYGIARAGAQHFTALQILTVCQKYNVNANWIFGLNDKIFIAQKKPVSNTLVKKIAINRIVNKKKSASRQRVK